MPNSARDGPARRERPLRYRRNSRQRAAVAAARQQEKYDRARLYQETQRYIDRRIHAEMQLLREQLQAIQAIDVGVHETGHLAIVTTVGGIPRVKVIPISPALGRRDYQRMVDQVRRKYGIAKCRIDGPPGAFDPWGRW